MPTPVTLKVFRGEELVRSERFARDIIKIGRLSSAHLCLEDDRVSRIHSVIEVAPDGHISIIDMGSAEGTFVNGKRVSKGPLRAGDEIKLGGLRVVLDGIEASGANCRQHPADDPDQGKDNRGHEQTCGMNVKLDVAGIARIAKRAHQG